MNVQAPCPHCRARIFSFIAKARIELVSDAKIGFGNVLRPEVSLLVCNGCGHTAWFMRDHVEMLEGVDCDTLKVPDEQYR